MAKSHGAGHVKANKPEDAPENESQDAGHQPENESQEGNGSLPSKADMVRAAIAAGADTGKPGVEWIKKTYGAHVDIDAGGFAASKSQIKKAEAKREGRELPPPTPRTSHAAPSGPSTSVAKAPEGLADDLAAIRSLISDLGDGDVDKTLDSINSIGSLLSKYGTGELTKLVKIMAP